MTRIVRARFSDARTLLILTVLTQPDFYKSGNDNILEDINDLHFKLYDYSLERLKDIEMDVDAAMKEIENSLAFASLSARELLMGRICNCLDKVKNGFFDFHIDQIRFLFELCYLKIKIGRNNNSIFTRDFQQKAYYKFFTGDVINGSYNRKFFLTDGGNFQFKENKIFMIS